MENEANRSLYDHNRSLYYHNKGGISFDYQKPRALAKLVWISYLNLWMQIDSVFMKSEVSKVDSKLRLCWMSSSDVLKVKLIAKLESN